MSGIIETKHVCRRDGSACYAGRISLNYSRNAASAFRQAGFIVHDVRSGFHNDPSLHTGVFSFLELVIYPGIWAIAAHRLAHVLFVMRVPFIPRLMSQAARLFTGIEIHPGAKIGRGFFIDHGHGVVVGETAEIGENVLLYQQVTLGGTGLSAGKRHPTLGSNIIVGAGAKILGPIRIGDKTIIGAGSIVVKDVPHDSVVVGNPGRVIKRFGKRLPRLAESDSSWSDGGHEAENVFTTARI